MKNKFLIISILPILFLSSCQNNSDTKLSNKTKTEVTTTSNNVTDKPVKDEIKVLAPSGTPALLQILYQKNKNMILLLLH